MDARWYTRAHPGRIHRGPQRRDQDASEYTVLDRKAAVIVIRPSRRAGYCKRK